MQPQWKMIYLARRNPTLAPEAFAQAWREHSARGRECRNVQDKVLGVAQCSRLLDLDLPGTSTEYDGVGLLRLRDLDAASDIWNDAETLAIMRPDEPRVFSTYVREFTLVCREYPLRDVPRSGCVLYGFLRRREGLSKAEFDTAWLDGSARWLDGDALRQAGCVMHNAVVQPPPPGYAFDGIAEWWFDSPDALRAAFGTDGVAAGLPPACASFIDLSGSVFLATQVTHSRP